jgi:hypothetical protein
VKFFNSSVEQALWLQGGFRALNTPGDTIPKSWARAQVIGKLAAARDKNIIRHITTDNVARDMLQIVRAHGREMIQYWGFSYVFLSVCRMLANISGTKDMALC